MLLETQSLRSHALYLFTECVDLVVERILEQDNPPNRKLLIGNWKQVSGKVKQQWGKLTDDSLAQINGKRDELVGRIQEAYGINRDEADRQVRDWESLNQ